MGSNKIKTIFSELGLIVFFQLQLKVLDESIVTVDAVIVSTVLQKVK